MKTSVFAKLKLKWAVGLYVLFLLGMCGVCLAQSHITS
jgi:hypothetical protein